MSIENPIHNVFDNYIPFMNEELLHNIFSSGIVPVIHNIDHSEIFNPNILNLDNKLELQSNNNNKNDDIIEKEWKNNEGEYIIKSKNLNNNNIILYSNHPLKKYYQIANYLSSFFNIYGINNKLPLILNDIIKNKNYSLITTSSKLLLSNKELTDSSQSIVTITKDKENLSNNQINNLSLLTKPWYILNFNKENEENLKTMFDKSKSQNKILINYLINPHEDKSILEKEYLNNIISWINNSKKSLI